MIGPIDSMMRWWRHGGPPGDFDPTPLSPRLASRMTSFSADDTRWRSRLDAAGIPRTLAYPSTSLGRLVDQAAERFGAHSAILYNGKRWTYSGLRAEVNRMAGGMAHLGVRRGDRIMLTLPNCPEFIIAFFAAQKLGAVVVNAGPLMGVDDLKTVLAMTGPRVVVGLDLQADTLSQASEHLGVGHWIWASLQPYQPVMKRMGYRVKLWQRASHNHGVSHIDWPELMENAPARPPTIEPDPHDIALLQPTGGTTGQLKLVQLCHSNLLANVTQLSAWSHFNPGQERICVVLPMFHIYSLTLCLLLGVYHACSMAVVTRFEANALLELMREFRPTMCPIVPAMCSALCDAIENSNQPATLDGLRLCISGAAPLPPAMAERFKHVTGSEIIEGFGLTEAGPVTHANLPGHNRAGSIGLPLPDTYSRICDLVDPSHDVLPGEPGELLVSGPQIMSGYLANPDATRAALYTDATNRTWLRTGDIAKMDADGFYSIVDRKKDMIIRSGLKVYPAKVEAVIAAHPNVKEVAVVGRADEVHTSTVVAVIVPKSMPADPQTFVRELRSRCLEHLAHYEVPAAFELANELPRSALGKLLKRKLRELPPAPVAAQPQLPASRIAGLLSDDEDPHTPTPPTNGNGNGHPRESVKNNTKGKEAA